MGDSEYRDPWPGQATVEDAGILDREAYERNCLAYLTSFPSLNPGWKRRGFALLAARLEGSFPDTTIVVRLRIPAVPEEIEEEWPIWRDEGAPVRDGAGNLYRWTPKQLIQDHLQSLYYET